MCARECVCARACACARVCVRACVLLEVTARNDRCLAELCGTPLCSFIYFVGVLPSHSASSSVFHSCFPTHDFISSRLPAGLPSKVSYLLVLTNVFTLPRFPAVLTSVFHICLSLRTSSFCRYFRHSFPGGKVVGAWL
jgi:hypothetical protein